MFKVQSYGYGQPCYCSSCLLNFQSFIINYCMIFVLLFIQNKLSCRLPITKNTANNEEMLSYSVCWVHTISLSLTCFFQKAIHLASPGNALIALLPDSVALRKAHLCSAHTVMIQNSAAPSSASLFLWEYHLQAHPPGYFQVAVSMLLRSSYNTVSAL